MYKLIKYVAFIALAGVLGACSSAGKDIEDTRSAPEIYADAKKSLDKKNYLTAVEKYRNLEAKYPYGRYAEQAQLDTIYAHYRADDKALAVSAAERFIKLHPTHPSVVYAYYIRALANYHEDKSWFGKLSARGDLSDRDASLTKKALDAFKDVYTLFPDSPYAAESRQRVQYLHHSLSRHELVVAAYYLSRYAYVAVVRRAKTIIENYNDTPAVEEALALLVYSYTAMQLPELSQDARRVLETNFPESPYLATDGKARLQKNLDYTGIAMRHRKRKKTILAPLLLRSEPAPEPPKY